MHDTPFWGYERCCRICKESSLKESEACLNCNHPLDDTCITFKQYGPQREPYYKLNEAIFVLSRNKKDKQFIEVVRSMAIKERYYRPLYETETIIALCTYYLNQIKQLKH